MRAEIVVRSFWRPTLTEIWRPHTVPIRVVPSSPTQFTTTGYVVTCQPFAFSSFV
jgi:hypothetical protein